MRFSKRSDASLWADIFNLLGFRVEEVVLKFEVKCEKSGDPRIRILGDYIYDASQHFQEEVRQAFEIIKTDEAEGNIQGLEEFKKAHKIT